MKIKQLFKEWKNFFDSPECDDKYFVNECNCKFINHCDDFCDIDDGHMKFITPIEDGNSRFDLVEQNRTFRSRKHTPHCKIHGAMNKVSLFEDGGGYWRCSASNKEFGNCRAGCMEISLSKEGK